MCVAASIIVGVAGAIVGGGVAIHQGKQTSQAMEDAGDQQISVQREMQRKRELIAMKQRNRRIRTTEQQSRMVQTMNARIAVTAEGDNRKLKFKVAAATWAAKNKNWGQRSYYNYPRPSTAFQM